MTVALSVAVGAGRRGGGLRLDRQHLGVDGGVRRAGRAASRSCCVPAGQDRRRQAGPGDRARRPGDHGARQLRRLPAAVPRAGRGLPGRAGQLGQPDAPRGAEDRRLRDRRLPRRRPRRARAAGRQRRQHLGVLEGLPRVRRRPAAPRARPRMWGWQAAGPRRSCRARRCRTRRRWPRRSGSATPPRGTSPWPRPTSPAAGSARSPTSRSSPPSASWPLATASSSSRPRPPASPGLLAEVADGARRYAGQQVVVTVTGHGLKDIDTALSTFTDLVDTVVDADVDAAAAARPDCGDRLRRTGPVTVSVPATSANLGPGFDCLGLALDHRDRVTAEVVDGPASEVDGRRAGGRASSRSTSGTWCYRSMLAAFERHAASTVPGLRLDCHNVDPARPRTRLVVGGDRRRCLLARGAGRRRLAADGRRRGARAGRRPRGASRQRGAGAVRRLHRGLPRR